MLLDRAWPRGAAAFEATLKKEPTDLGPPWRRQGRRAAGDQAGGPAALCTAVALTENADPVRPEIAEARAFVAKN
jgi:hypothetical protein